MRHVIIYDGKVVNAIEADLGYVAQDGFLCIPSENGNIGDHYDGSGFVSPVASFLSEIVINSIVSDNPDSIINDDFSEINCPVGSKLTCTAEMRAQDGSVIPLDDTFRMPLRSSDGKERFVFVKFEAGLAMFSGTMYESGLWSINKEAINSRLPAEKHMAMKEVSIYVCI